MEIKNLNESIVDEFLQVLEQKEYRENTIKNYKCSLVQFIDYLGDNVLLHDVDLSETYSFFAHLEETNDYKPRTFNLKISAVKALFEYMSMIGERNSIPITGLMYKRLDKKSPVVLDTKEQKLWVAHLAKHAFGDQALAARIQLKAGLRVDEVINLDLKKDFEVKGEKGYLHIRRAKGRRERIAPIFDDSLTKDLKDLQDLYFFADEFKLYLHKNPYQYQTKVFFEKTGIRITSHMLRSTFATERYEEGLDLNTIRILLGHTSVNTTLQYLVYRKNIYDLIA